MTGLIGWVDILVRFLSDHCYYNYKLFLLEVIVSEVFGDYSAGNHDRDLSHPFIIFHYFHLDSSEVVQKVHYHFKNYNSLVKMTGKKKPS